MRNGLTFSCSGHGCCFGNVSIDVVGHVIHSFSVSVGGKGIGLVVAEHFFRVSLFVAALGLFEMVVRVQDLC